MPWPPIAWPAKAMLPTKAAATIAAAALSWADAPPVGDSRGLNIAARMPARTRRTPQSLPKSVCDTAVHSTSPPNTSATVCPLIDAAVSTNQAAPDSTDRPRLISAIQARRHRSVAADRAPFAAPWNAGSAINTTKNMTPATMMVAAK